VAIGTQCWLAKNLNLGTMINVSANVDSQRNNGVIEKYCYNNDPANCTSYGGLYQWAEAVQYKNGASNTASPNPAFTGNVQGICPTGWHLPSENDWCFLTTFLDTLFNCNIFGYNSTTAGGILKSTNSLWNFPNAGATNISGFSAFPGGWRVTNGIFNYKQNSFFWSCNEYSLSNSIYRSLYSNASYFLQKNGQKNSAFSVRCLKD
jgi:uncharacterized protein (TIGR02145 family)